MDIEKFRKKMDSDKGFISKRRTLVTLSVISALLNFSGAEIHGINTVIFNIEFKNENYLIYFLIPSIIFMLTRYYAYSQPYQSSLFILWSDRMMNDYRVFNTHHEIDDISGLLAKRIHLSPAEEPGIYKPKYKILGIFKRNLTYESADTDTDEYGAPFSYHANIELNKYSENWKRSDFIKLLVFEAKYQIEALIKYRESLDLLFPYIISFIGLASYLFR